jgi:hypothetical protein
MSVKIAPAAFEPQSREKRHAPRAAITLPILVRCDGTRFNATLRNLSRDGAMIDFAMPLIITGDIRFECGSIGIGAAIRWIGDGGVGIKFSNSITEQQFREQLMRSEAVARWREGRRYLGRSGKMPHPVERQSLPATG